MKTQRQQISNRKVQEAHVRACATAKRCLPPAVSDEVVGMLEESYKQHIAAQKQLDQDFALVMGLLNMF